MRWFKRKPKTDGGQRVADIRHREIMETLWDIAQSGDFAPLDARIKQLEWNWNQSQASWAHTNQTVNANAEEFRVRLDNEIRNIVKAQDDLKIIIRKLMVLAISEDHESKMKFAAQIEELLR